MGEQAGKGIGGGKKGMLGGAAMLAGAALLSKLIGTLQKIPLQNVAGDRVFGIYNAVYPFYQLILVLATAGLPVAVAIRTATLLEAEDRVGARQAAAAGVVLLSLFGAAGFALLWAEAEAFARLVGDPAAARSVRAVAASLWFAPALAALRGYTQGSGDLRPTAWSQLAEQCVRVAAMLLLLRLGWEAGWSEEGLAAGAMSGSFFGGAAGLLLLVWLMRRPKASSAAAEATEEGAKERSGCKDSAAVANGGMLTSAAGRSGIYWELEAERREQAEKRSGTLPLMKGLTAEMRRLGVIALPVALGAIVSPVLGVIDAFTVPRLLSEGGLSGAEAMIAFGLYSRGQPLIQLVAMVAGAAAGAVVPQLVRSRRAAPHEAAAAARLALRAAALAGAAAAAGLIVLAKPLNVMFYTDAQATGTLALVGSTALAAALSAVCAPLLQSLGALRTPAALLLLAALAKAALNAALVPPLGIAGAAWAGIAATALAALLGALATARAAAALAAPPAQPARAALRRLAAAALALAAMSAAAGAAVRAAALLAALAPALPPRLSAAAQTLAGVALGAAVYGAALLRLGAVSAAELRLLPGGAGLAARLARWRLLPRRSR
ncbi:oligosaccharide flippase family protein [Paenibacillus pasadenensis]|uniref:oligosaccharide flippase family protein n=1 Tax=Paenibacillus pasadenensis TaxID=217090 RepID=UPI002040487C|nr:oligosaccharide flippase family protein [Paenibacillus pasadenensis]MCM3750053.1 oligosaccharide flippase family protein [Paenibacillus pasadenensis]